jgi:hypothetical protein
MFFFKYLFQEGYSYPTYKQLMKPFRNVEFIDLVNWNMFVSNIEDWDMERYSLQAIKELQEDDKNAFQNLKGIKLNPKEDWADILSFPIKLTHLSLTCKMCGRQPGYFNLNKMRHPGYSKIIN